jgi:hypothetical protein
LAVPGSTLKFIDIDAIRSMYFNAHCEQRVGMASHRRWFESRDELPVIADELPQ